MRNLCIANHASKALVFKKLQEGNTNQLYLYTMGQG